MWENEITSTSDCKISIPPKNKTPKYLSLWSSDRMASFTFCSRINDRADLRGVYPVVIRIDGKYKNKDIKPIYFYGYLYTEKVTTTNKNKDGTPSEIPIGLEYPYDVVIFKEGNWEDDPRIPVIRPVKDE